MRIASQNYIKRKEIPQERMRTLSFRTTASAILVQHFYIHNYELIISNIEYRRNFKSSSDKLQILRHKKSYGAKNNFYLLMSC